MKPSPFNTQAAGERITFFLKDKLIPSVKQLQELAVDTSFSKLDVVSALTGHPFKKLEARYLDLAGQFLDCYRTWSDPELLFKDLDKSEIAAYLQDWYNFKSAAEAHFDVGFRLIDHVDRSISGQKSSVYNGIATLLSILAITLSIITAISS